jgi:hypothetical protein
MLRQVCTFFAPSPYHNGEIRQVLREPAFELQITLTIFIQSDMERDNSGSYGDDYERLLSSEMLHYEV